MAGQRIRRQTGSFIAVAASDMAVEDSALDLNEEDRPE